MINKLAFLLCLMFLFLSPSRLQAKEIKYIEIFDPKADKVVKIVPLNPKIESTVVNWVRNINSICTKLDPTTDDGYALRVPLETTYIIQSKWLNAVIEEVYIIVPEKEPPFFMIFENENKLTAFPFTGDIDKL